MAKLAEKKAPKWVNIEILADFKRLKKGEKHRVGAETAKTLCERKVKAGEKGKEVETALAKIIE